MKRNAKYIVVAIIIVLIILIVVMMQQNKKEKQDDGKFKIVTSFYPIYIMTANITQGAENINLVNMTELNTGCVHDYTLSTEDMKQIENADVFIQNGLGLESFIEKITDNNKELKIIDSSKDITNVIEKEGEVNPHIWISLNSYIRQVKNIAEVLSESNPENANIYQKNTEEYIKKIGELQSRYETELYELKTKSAVCLNESFEYLGRDLNLNLTTIHTNHEESTMSAESLKNVIDTMKQNDIKIILVDVNDDLTNAQTIANETGAVIYKLDSALQGTLDKESYMNSMNGNLEILKEAIKK